ncbi:alanine--tRNA ligase [Buchnera aphidicola (Mindarus keteleerifoliae)]|uniref:alanine--tRNA ligase n=1 Tax=Buchnera aphidicola TaxID=9 RepID=UPI0031B70F53
MKKSINDIRAMFLEFFKKKDHTIISGSSIIPKNDSSLLFTNAGMNQFKDVFLGKEKITHKKIATVQNCLRTGGKHNDLNNVGFTPYHNTFFEMLGNFSFGEYFKKEAIKYAWELLTSNKWFNLPAEKLIVTVHDSDEETYDVWKNIIKMPLSQIIRIEKKEKIFLSENFWKMGSSGPCGPCTEIFFNTEKTALNKKNFFNNDKYIEIWNIVFIQFNLLSNGTIIDLPYKSVDTGMGLERITSILQKKNSNYKIDLFKKLIFYLSNTYNIQDLNNQSLYIIADHIRTSLYIISNGIQPSNEGRGYVLRRLIRRALRHGLKIGIKNAFLYKIIPYLIKLIENSGCKFIKEEKKIKKILKSEEIQFLKILKKGIIILNKNILKINNNVLPGEIVFKLHDTYGFPVDLIDEICKEKKIILDYQNFNKLMENQKKKSKKSNKFSFIKNYLMSKIKPTIFLGYEKKEITTTILGIFLNEINVEKTQSKSEKIVLVLKETPFYAESGGQIGDSGEIYNECFNFLVEDTKKNGSVIIHFGKLIKGTIQNNSIVKAKINIKKRKAIEINHSATHLLHSALKIALNQNIIQKGSLITQEYFRFDFLYPGSISEKKIRKIEKIINNKIWENLKVKFKIIYFEEAKKRNIIFLENKKYDTKVRVLSIDNFSHELCAGTHVKKTKEIGILKITSCNSIASNIHRIEAVTKNKALLLIQKKESILNQIKTILKEKEEEIIKKINFLSNKHLYFKSINKKFEKYEIKEIAKKILKKGILIDTTRLIIYQFQERELSFIKNLINYFKNHLSSFIVILTNKKNKKISILVNVTNVSKTLISALKIINFITKKINGKGGGNEKSAQGGGTNPKNNNLFIKEVKNWILSVLKQNN